jgi:hypothetical protein
LDGVSARRKAAMYTQNKHTHVSMPRVGFEPMIPMFERAEMFHALDRSDTVIGHHLSAIPQLDIVQSSYWRSLEIFYAQKRRFMLPETQIRYSMKKKCKPRTVNIDHTRVYSPMFLKLQRPQSGVPNCWVAVNEHEQQ